MVKTLQRVPNFQLMLRDAQIRAIGHVVVQWGFLESEINREIAWLLSRSEHKGKRVNFRSRFSTISERWRTLAQRTYKGHPDRLKAVNRIVGAANKIKPERDNIVHGTYGSSGIFFKMRDGKVIDISDTIGSPSYIEDLACRISDISVLLFKHHAALRKNFRKHP